MLSNSQADQHESSSHGRQIDASMRDRASCIQVAVLLFSELVNAHGPGSRASGRPIHRNLPFALSLQGQ